MTRTELLSLESDHPNLVDAILRSSMAGCTFWQGKMTNTELGEIARKLQVNTVRHVAKDWETSDIYTLELTYMEVEIQLIANVPVR